MEEKKSIPERCFIVWTTAFIVCFVFCFSLYIDTISSILISLIGGTGVFLVWFVLKAGKRMVMNTLTPPQRKVNDSPS